MTWTHFLNRQTSLYDRRWWWKAFGFRIWRHFNERKIRKLVYQGKHPYRKFPNWLHNMKPGLLRSYLIAVFWAGRPKYDSIRGVW